jgi:hypothetical protein
MNIQNRRDSKTASLNRLQWIAIALVAITGALHVFAGLAEGRVPVALAGVGYAGAIVLFFLNYRRRSLYLIGIPYTAVQFPLWIVAKSEYGMIDYVDKAVQVILIVVLIYLYLNTPSEPTENAVTTAD